jgi:hypothetical protein
MSEVENFSLFPVNDSARVHTHTHKHKHARIYYGLYVIFLLTFVKDIEHDFFICVTINCTWKQETMNLFGPKEAKLNR